jgi:uncharacterized protein (DUF362 family)
MDGKSIDLKDSRVAYSRTGSYDYPTAAGDESLSRALVRCCNALGWSDAERGSFGRLIKPGDRVVIKPNLVLHANQGSSGLLPLVTNLSVVQSVVNEVRKADPSYFSVGDAPIQMCDWNKLMENTGLQRWAESMSSDSRFGGLKDYRRTICEIVDGVRIARENIRPADDYVLFNLGADSLLEPITEGDGAFRVTSYDPRLLAKTHSPGNHQYLIARDVLEADVVINLPKLKTHKKAGISCALKNLVGINGNKEYLPHHRIGGSDKGGDCYPGHDRTKRSLEWLFDRKNKSPSPLQARGIHFLERQLQRGLRLKGDRIGVEGSWSGNNTVPRMTLDLNRILLYGRLDGSLSDSPQRRIVNVVDAVIAGQGEGPLANDELPLGMILAGPNQAAVDVVGARLLGYDPQKIASLVLAFDNYRWPITDFGFGDVTEINADSNNGDAHVSRLHSVTGVRHPAGWMDAVSGQQQ